VDQVSGSSPTTTERQARRPRSRVPTRRMSWSDGILGTHMLAAALETTVDDATGGGTQAQPSQTAVSGRPVLDGLEGDDRQALIAPGGVRRVVFSEQRGPMALPVNVRMFDGDIVFRTAPLPTLTSSFGQGQGSFEVDHLDEALTEGWSVLVSGEGHVIVDPAERQQVETLGISPWAGGDRDVYVRIVAREVTDRRIRHR
jgi:nitroimidazol reductase NimA-like FMN-containing flavoprotein (pyridoxamine 5'-phosphate oxidase superfamily)